MRTWVKTYYTTTSSNELNTTVLEFLDLLKRRSDYVDDEGEEKTRVVERTRLLKEEIMQKAWSPDRMERWLSAGFDPDD